MASCGMGSNVVSSDRSIGAAAGAVCVAALGVAALGVAALVVITLVVDSAGALWVLNENKRRREELEEEFVC